MKSNATTIASRLDVTSWWYRSFVVVLSAVVISMILARFFELQSMVLSNPTNALKLAAVVFALPTFVLLPPHTLGLLVRRLGLIVVIVATLKSDMDQRLGVKIKEDMHRFVAIVTGANSGIGLQTTKKLLESGVTVVMACRSLEKCLESKQEISSPTNSRRLVTMQLNLSDLASVRAFSVSFLESFSRLDILVNNAGFLGTPGSKTEQGLEHSFGAMHIGHFALTKWLLDRLLTPVEGEKRAARIINVSSAAYFAGDFHSSIMTGDGLGDLYGEVTDNCGFTGPWGLVPCCPATRCPLTNGYSRAKLANILHLHELQIHTDAEATDASSPRRRLVTASLHPGTVSTNIHPNFKRAGWLIRSADEAANVVMHAIVSDSFLPGSFIDAMQRAHDLQHFRQAHLHRHMSAYPETKDLPFARTPAVHIRSLDEYFWNSTSLASIDDSESKEAIARRLWEVSNRIVDNWEMQAAVTQRMKHE